MSSVVEPPRGRGRPRMSEYKTDHPTLYEYKQAWLARCKTDPVAWARYTEHRNELKRLQRARKNASAATPVKSC